MCQSFLLRSTQRRRTCTRRGCEEEGKLGGWRACLSTPRETHNQRTTNANIPNCATPQSTAIKTSRTARLTTQIVMRQSTANGTLCQRHAKRQSTVFRCIKTPRTVGQENSHLHMSSRPQCACILEDHQDWMALRQAL